MKKICYIVSDINKSLAFEWIALRLKEKYDLSFILLNKDDSYLEQFLEKNQVQVIRVPYHGKSNFLSAFWETYKLLRKRKPDVVHCHLFDAQLIGLTAGWLAAVKKRIYTRHNSNFHHAYQPQGVKYDKWSNRMSTHIVSISQATDYTLRSLERVQENKIRKIPHGFDFNDFRHISRDRVELVRRKWNIAADKIVVGVVARHIEWKGIQYIVPAFEKFREKYPASILVLANASGPYHKHIEEMLPAGVIQIPFEDDVAALYSSFSIYVHTPVDSIVEAFGQTYVEALAVGVPSVFTRSGIAAEFIQHNENALVVDFKNSDAIAEAMDNLASNEGLRERLVKKGKEDVFSRFGIEKMISHLVQLYDE